MHNLQELISKRHGMFIVAQEAVFELSDTGKVQNAHDYVEPEDVALIMRRKLLDTGKEK